MSINQNIVYTSPFVPSELISAYGLKPYQPDVSVTTEPQSLTPVKGICPYARKFLEYVCKHCPAGCILTTECDQMRRIYDLVRLYNSTPVFLLNFPKVAGRSDSLDLFTKEFNRLAGFLADVSGRLLQKDEFADRILESAVTGQKNSSEVKSVPGKPKLALIGNHSCQLEAVSRELRKSGKFTVLNLAESLYEVAEKKFDPAKCRNAPLRSLSKAYLNIPSPAVCPAELFYNRLKNYVNKYRIDGVILHRYVCCDLWHSKLYILKKLFDVPVLDIEAVDVERELNSRTEYRIQAFTEMLNRDEKFKN